MYIEVYIEIAALAISGCIGVDWRLIAMDKKKYPIGAESYILYEEVGTGVSASVHRALCILFSEIVAVKILDFERNNSDLVHSLFIDYLSYACGVGGI